MKNLIRIGSVSLAVLAFFVMSLGASSPALAVTGTSSATASVPLLAYVRTTTPVYSIPSTNGLVEGQLLAGQTWFVLGQDATGGWVEVQIPSNSGLASWVPFNTLALDGVTLPLSSRVTPLATTGTATASATATAAASSTASASASASASATTQASASATSASGTRALMTVPFLTTVRTTTTVYDQPSTSGDAEGQITAGQTWFVLGQDAAGGWIQIQIPSNNGLPGWVPANTLAVGGLNIPLSPLVTPFATSATSQNNNNFGTATPAATATDVATATP